MKKRKRSLRKLLKEKPHQGAFLLPIYFDLIELNKHNYKNMKATIIAKDREHLEKMIQAEIKLNGNECDLNYIDVSKIKDLNRIFQGSKFNGNISKWDVSNVEYMNCLFHMCSFNGDISKWNTSKVKNMRNMFQGSSFNKDISNWDTSNVEIMTCMFFGSDFTGDISKWDVSNVIDMEIMFKKSKFNSDLSQWKPYKLENKKEMFYNCSAPIPYWYLFENNNERKRAINKYWLVKELQENLYNNQIPMKKPKI